METNEILFVDYVARVGIIEPDMFCLTFRFVQNIQTWAEMMCDMRITKRFRLVSHMIFLHVAFSVSFSLKGYRTRFYSEAHKLE